MTDIEQKALALLNEVLRLKISVFNRAQSRIHEALCRAIEQHEAFRQEVSDAVDTSQAAGLIVHPILWRFIIAKPVDPLVEALAEATGQGNYIDERDAIALRAAMKARGYEWRKIEGEG